jgi:hypothetical protein
MNTSENHKESILSIASERERQHLIGLYSERGEWVCGSPDLNAERQRFLVYATDTGRALGLSQAAIANRLSVSPATWSRFVGGRKYVSEEASPSERFELQRSTQAAMLSGLKTMVFAVIKELSRADEAALPHYNAETLEADFRKSH